MLKTKVVPAVEDSWLAVPAIALGTVPTGLGTPDSFVTVAADGRPTVRLDLYVDHGKEIQFATQALEWHNLVIVGIGHRVHVVHIDSRKATSISLGEYFAGFFARENVLLITSASRVLRLAEDGSVLWQSPSVGIDGVVIQQTDRDKVYGKGEFDPPGGWRSFCLDLRTGLPAT